MPATRPLTERQEQVLLMLLEHEQHSLHGMTPNEIGHKLGLPLVTGGRGEGGRGRGHRVFGPAQRVIGTLNGLTTRGLLISTFRKDGRSGSAYVLTNAGMKVARDLEWKAGEDQ